MRARQARLAASHPASNRSPGPQAPTPSHAPQRLHRRCGGGAAARRRRLARGRRRGRLHRLLRIRAARAGSARADAAALGALPSGARRRVRQPLRHRAPRARSTSAQRPLRLQQRRPRRFSAQPARRVQRRGARLAAARLCRLVLRPPRCAPRRPQLLFTRTWPAARGPYLQKPRRTCAPCFALATARPPPRSQLPPPSSSALRWQPPCHPM